MLALEGINILDLSRAGPGPFCTMILGDLGAEVIIIEAPSNVSERQAGFGRTLYRPTNRNKKSIRLNLKSEDGCNIFYQLAEKADVVVEGFRPGVAKRLGIDYPTISKINPRIVYCSITGYGQDGPYHNLPGHDVNYLSFAGVLNLIGERGGRPVIPLNLVADLGGGGMSAVVGILSAIIARDKTGRGQSIDLSVTDSVVSLLTGAAFAYFRGEKIPDRGEVALGGGYPYYNVYKTKDGKFISIGCIEPWFWENLCRAIGKEEFIPFHFELDHHFQPPGDKKWEEVSSSLRQIFLTKTRDEWFDLLNQKDIPIGKVYSLDEVSTDPHVLHREMMTEVEHPIEGKVKQAGIAIKLSDTPGKVRSLPPAIGEHTEEVLTALGYNKQRIGELRREGIIG